MAELKANPTAGDVDGTDKGMMTMTTPLVEMVVSSFTFWVEEDVYFIGLQSADGAEIRSVCPPSAASCPHRLTPQQLHHQESGRRHL